MIATALGPNRVIATIRIDDVGLAAPTVVALEEGGVNVVEVLLRNDTGLAAISAISSEVPSVLLGAGTVLDVSTLEQAVEAGAAFAVSPGFDREVASRAVELGVPYLPGAVTATEIQACLRLGLSTVKFFPASTSGGPDALRALSAALSVAGVGFVPTGGVDDTNVLDYLGVATVRAVGMSWIATAAHIREHAFDVIAERARLVSRLAEAPDR